MFKTFSQWANDNCYDNYDNCYDNCYVSFPSEVISLHSSFSILGSCSWKLWSPVIFSWLYLTFRDAHSIPYCLFHFWLPFYKFKFYLHLPSKQTFQRNWSPYYFLSCICHYFCITFFFPLRQVKFLCNSLFTLLTDYTPSMVWVGSITNFSPGFSFGT